MLEATYEQVKSWLIQIKEDMDLGDLPEDDTENELDFE